MSLNMTPQLWHALCAAASAYPTCTIHLRQHQGWVKSFTIEHGPGEGETVLVTPPVHVQYDQHQAAEAWPSKP
jgi:hypothetical protein